MPVTSQPLKASMAIIIEERDEMGSSKIKRRSYNNLKTNASEESVFNVATALIGLSEDTFLDLESIKVNHITSY